MLSNSLIKFDSLFKRSSTDIKNKVEDQPVPCPLPPFACRHEEIASFHRTAECHTAGNGRDSETIAIDTGQSARSSKRSLGKDTGRAEIEAQCHDSRWKKGLFAAGRFGVSAWKMGGRCLALTTAEVGLV